MSEFVVRFESWETLYSVDARRNGLRDLAGQRDCGVGDAFVLELYGIAEPFTIGCLYVAFVRTIVFRQGVEISTVNGVECPMATRIRFFMDLDIAPHRG